MPFFFPPGISHTELRVAPDWASVAFVNLPPKYFFVTDSVCGKKVFFFTWT